MHDIFKTNGAIKGNVLAAHLRVLMCVYQVAVNANANVSLCMRVYSVCAPSARARYDDINVLYDMDIISHLLPHSYMKYSLCSRKDARLRSQYYHI